VGLPLIVIVGSGARSRNLSLVTLCASQVSENKSHQRLKQSHPGKRPRREEPRHIRSREVMRNGDMIGNRDAERREALGGSVARDQKAVLRPEAGAKQSPGAP
jgi:hypothetical protein